MRDFDRPLEPTGRADAEAIGAAIASASYVPDLVICSTAKRARETLESVQPCIGDIAVIYSDELYGTDAAGYLDVIRTEAIGENVLLVGHNPMMEDLAFALSGGGDSHARDLLSAGFPTSGLAVIRFDTPLTEAAPGKGYLEAFLSPADL